MMTYAGNCRTMNTFDCEGGCDMKNEVRVPLFEEISRWRSSCEGEGCAVSPQQHVVDVQDVCGLLRMKKKQDEHTPLYNLLYQWYMPRNEEHTRHYMGRYAVLGNLQDKIMNCVEERRSKR